MVGDVMLGRLVNEVLRERPADHPWGDTIEVFRTADWRVCNLECVLSDRVVPAFPEKAFHFRSDARNVEVLKAAGIDAISLANNHVLDFGEEALLDTLQLLDRAGIGHAGAGRDLAEASRPSVGGAAGFGVGLLACTDYPPEWAAQERRPGVFHVPAELESAPVQERLLPAVTQARERVDLLIVSLHWGPNWGYEPPPEHRPLARALVEAGADVVFGHSGHIFRGVEVHRGRPIIYCAGNFVDDYAVDPVERNDQSFIFLLEADGRTLRRLRLRPTMIAGFQAQLAQGFDAAVILRTMEDLCTALGTRLELRGSEGVIELTL